MGPPQGTHILSPCTLPHPNHHADTHPGLQETLSLQRSEDRVDLWKGTYVTEQWRIDNEGNPKSSRSNEAGMPKQESSLEFATRHTVACVLTEDPRRSYLLAHVF